jgi:hypothetical protein
MKKILFILILMLCSTQLFATNYTVAAVPVSAPAGFSGVVYTHTFAATRGLDTVYCPFTLTKSLDSIYVVAVTYKTHADSIFKIGVRLRQSPNNTSWKLTTIGTDSTTWDTPTQITLATAKVQDFSISPSTTTYRLYPYNQLMIVGLATLGSTAPNDVGSVIKIYLYTRIK